MKRFEELQILIEQLHIKIYKKYDYSRGANVETLIKSDLTGPPYPNCWYTISGALEAAPIPVKVEAPNVAKAADTDLVT